MFMRHKSYFCPVPLETVITVISSDLIRSYGKAGCFIWDDWSFDPCQVYAYAIGVIPDSKNLLN